MAGDNPTRRERRIRAVMAEATGIPPEDAGHVLLDQTISTTSVQRAELYEVEDSWLVLSVWPGELKDQALYLHSHGRGQRLAALDGHDGWSVYASPQLAFFTAPPDRRLYMTTELDVDAYPRQWEEGDTDWVGQYTPEAARGELWPWLLERGYASPEQDDLDWFLGVLSSRKAHLRPGMVAERTWSKVEAQDLDEKGELVGAVRSALNEILGVLDEPPVAADEPGQA